MTPSPGQFLFSRRLPDRVSVRFFMRNFIKALPFDLIEIRAHRRRRKNGASSGTWSCRLIRPAIAALAVLIFTFVWNDFFWANVSDPGRNRKADHGRRHEPLTDNS